MDAAKNECITCDVIVTGTGLTQSLMVASLAARGYRVVQLESGAHYGGMSGSLSLTQLIHWCESLPLRSSVPNGDWIPHDESLTRKNIISLDNKVDLSDSCVVKRRFYSRASMSVDSSDEQAVSDKVICDRYSIDLASKVYYSKSYIIDLLIKARVDKYVEFRTLDSPLSLGVINDSENTLKVVNVPVSRDAIFGAEELSLTERRLMMKFLQRCLCWCESGGLLQSPAAAVYEKEKSGTNTEHHCSTDFPTKEKYSEEAEDEMRKSGEEWHALMENNNLTEKLCEYLMYGVCLIQELDTGKNLCQNIAFSDRWADKLSSFDNMKKMKAFVLSMGIHSKVGPFIYPMYGNGDIVQALARAVALQGSTQMLNTSISKVLLKHDSGEELEMYGAVLNNGTLLHSKFLITEESQLRCSLPGKNPIPLENACGACERKSSDTHTHRLIVIIENQPLLGGPGFRIATFPASGHSYETSKCRNPIQVIQVDANSGCVPKKQFLYYFIHVCNNAQCVAYDCCNLPYMRQSPVFPPPCVVCCLADFQLLEKLTVGSNNSSTILFLFSYLCLDPKLDFSACMETALHNVKALRSKEAMKNYENSLGCSPEQAKPVCSECALSEKTKELETFRRTTHDFEEPSVKGVVFTPNTNVKSMACVYEPLHAFYILRTLLYYEDGKDYDLAMEGVSDMICSKRNFDKFE